MTKPIEELAERLRARLGARAASIEIVRGEATLVVPAAEHLGVAQELRDDPALGFEQAIDLCGVDYLAYGDGGDPAVARGRRFAAVVHLLSVSNNWRLRLRTFCEDDEFPTVASLVGVWPSLGWFEREAFDLYGIVFEGHPDLRRILTDYGFIGHPFRKDFPISGHVEMRYDPDQKRVIYQPVTIEPREVTPRVVREDNYARGS
jgi:NADH-quinone oxidoreductase subunit C